MKRFFVCTATCLSVLASPIGWACSYDGQFNNPFTEGYPGSLDVAIATQQAMQASELMLPEKVEGQQGLRRASWWLSLLVENNKELQEEGYVYLVDSQLWSTYRNGKITQIHATPPDDSNTLNIVLLSEAALNSIVNNKLPLSLAVGLGIVKL